MALQRRQLTDPLAQLPHPAQLGLFDQRGVTVGAVEASQNAVKRELEGRARPVPGTRFPARAGCALHCECESCLNPSLQAGSVCA